MSDPIEFDTDVDEPIVVTKTRPKARTSTETATRREPPYNVIILNDDFHTFEYVIELLVKLFRHSVSTAEELAHTIDKSGRAVVYTTHKEKAELKCEQVRSYGADPSARVEIGPLGCYIEPAPSD
jgi:ATP-dependent Clp protease adaptor protein ClpS